jgi:hypothetical protein
LSREPGPIAPETGIWTGNVSSALNILRFSAENSERLKDSHITGTPPENGRAQLSSREVGTDVSANMVMKKNENHRF